MIPARKIISKLKRLPCRFAIARVLCTSAFVIAIASISLDTIIDRQPIAIARYLSVNPSPVLLDRNGRILHISLNDDDAWSVPISAEHHSRYMRDAVITTEDQRFESHAGVDPVAILRAVTQAIRDRKITSGASTITMQLVKMTDHKPRTIPGKLNQMWTAVLLERHAAKDQILSAYLNRASYGANLIGIQAASLRYFGKPSDELSLSECALLAAIPKSPAKFDPLRHPDRARERRNFVLYRMHEENRITSQTFKSIVKRPLRVKWHAFPAHAPHLARSLETNDRLTIDLDQQTRVQDLLREQVARFNPEITHGAVIVLDIQTGQTISRVGSPDFFDSRGGQIDMTTQPRSPGSTLKPFAYAEALQKNKLYPAEILLDDTLDYRLYSPGNYDGTHNGLISATQALRFSLNIPSVMILNRIGVKTFQRQLRRLGMSTLEKNPNHYGLGLVLGNCELRLDELATAYLALANLGQPRPPTILLNEPRSKESEAIWSKGVVTTLYEMLQQPLPRELHDQLIRPDAALPKVCWKTGTSTGHHDAWAFVFNQQYLVGVWMGNTNGQRSDRLIGATTTLPLAAKIFRGLPPTQSQFWPSAIHLREIRICATSGLSASKNCTNQKTGRIPNQQFINRSCDLHTQPDETRWPPDALNWDLSNIQAPKSVTATNFASKKSPNRALKITSPANNSQFRISHAAQGDRIQLKTSLRYNAPLFWYQNQRFLGKSTVHNPLYLDLTEGKHTLSCMVPTGETSTITFTVSNGDPRRDRSFNYSHYWRVPFSLFKRIERQLQGRRDSLR